MLEEVDTDGKRKMNVKEI